MASTWTRCIGASLGSPSLPSPQRSRARRAERTEKEALRSLVEVRDCDAGPVEVLYYGGRPMKKWLLEAGDKALVDLAWKQVRRNRNSDGTWRIYIEYELACNYGKHRTTHRDRTITSTEDVNRDLNHGENVRAVPLGTDAYDASYPKRSTIEGDNRRIDDYLPLRRARSYGKDRHLLDLFAHAHRVTSYGPCSTDPVGAAATRCPTSPSSDSPREHPSGCSRGLLGAAPAVAAAGRS